MVDTVMSHEVLRRFEAIEARLDALEGGNTEQGDQPTEETDDFDVEEL